MEAFLVIPSLEIGGMEKRLTDIWLHLVRRGLPVNLVISGRLLDLLERQPEFREIRSWAERIIAIDPADGSYPALVRALLPIIRTAPRGSVFHYLLTGIPFLHRWYGHRTIVSWVGTYLPRWRSSRGAFNFWAISRLSFLSADVIDVLNPHIQRELSRSPRLAPKLRVTRGGTFVRLDHYRPAKAKKNWVVFLGRLEAGKGVLDFARSLPVLVQQLGDAAPDDLHFHFIGRDGDQAGELRALLGTPEFRDLPITLTGHLDDPAAILGEAKVFVSLQGISNYPSKSLAEAMACGAVPVITDVGDSRQMASAEGAEFLPYPFTTDQLAAAIADVIRLPAKAFDARSGVARRDAESRFGIEAQAEYFADLYFGSVSPAESTAS